MVRGGRRISVDGTNLHQATGPPSKTFGAFVIWVELLYGAWWSRLLSSSVRLANHEENRNKR